MGASTLPAGTSDRQNAVIEAQPTAEPTASPEPSQEPTAQPTKTALPAPAATSQPTATATIVFDAQGEHGIVDYGIDLACLGTWGHGVTCLNNIAEWHSFTQESSPLGGDFIADIDSCNDGTMLILHGSGVSALDGQEWREFPGEWGFDSPEAITCTGSDEFWVAHLQGVSYFNGANWFNIDSGNLSFGEEATGLVKDVVADDSDNVWIVTVNSVTFYDGSGWVIYQLGQGFSEKVFFDAIALDGDGRPWVVHSDGLSAFEDGDWEVFKNRNLFILQDVAVDQSDNKWVGTLGQGLAVFDGATWQIRDRMSGDLESDSINKIEVDDAGRVWVATEYGLHIFDGQTWRVYRMDNADLAENSIRALEITGSPMLPETEEKETGSISGSITLDDEPYAYKNIEICVEPLGKFFEGETPCYSQPFMRREVTDSAGTFSFSDVPPGYYVLSTETGDSWQQLTTEFGFGNKRVPIVSGQDSNVGVLTLNIAEE